MLDSLSSVWGTLPDPLRNQLEGYAIGFWSVLPQLILSIVFLCFLWAIIRIVQAVVPGAYDDRIVFSHFSRTPLSCRRDRPYRSHRS